MTAVLRQPQRKGGATMARTRYATDRGLIARMGATMFLLGLVFTGFIMALVVVLTYYQHRRSGGGANGVIHLLAGQSDHGPKRAL